MTLTYDRTVDRRLVHKNAVENVFVTDVGRQDDGALLAAVRFPLLHRSHVEDGAGHHDLLLVAEVCRQAVAAITHTLLDVPLTAKFVITEMTVSLHRRSALSGPEGVVRFVPGRERRRKDGSLRAVNGRALCTVGGVHAATFEGVVIFLPEDAYETVRDAANPPRPYDGPRAEPTAVGRRDRRNVVITPPVGGRAELVADPADSNFFDHELDHLPGMLLLEAARQLGTHAAALDTGLAATELVAVACGGKFSDFAEFGTPVTLGATVEAGEVRVAVEQGDRRLTTIALTVEKGAR
jgi:2-oxo-3-(phosphooxy)propyl 3-oxoalkanoate synthase